MGGEREKIYSKRKGLSFGRRDKKARLISFPQSYGTHYGKEKGRAKWFKKKDEKKPLSIGILLNWYCKKSMKVNARSMGHSLNHGTTQCRLGGLYEERPEVGGD